MAIVKYIIIIFLSLNLYSHETVNFNEKEQKWLKNHKKIKVRVGSTPPLHFFENNTPKGISVEYIELIAKKIGVEIEFLKDIDWPNALEYMKKNEKIDIILTIKRTKEREEFIEFTKDYLEIPWVIFTRDDNKKITNIKDLKEKSVSVEEAYVMHKKLQKEYPTINLKVVKTSIDALTALATNRVDAYIGNLLTSSYIIQKYNLSNIKVAGATPFDNHNQAMGVKKEYPELASIIDKVLNSLSQEEHNKIREKWLAIRDESKIDYELILKIVALFLIITLSILYWNRKLSIEIEKRKVVEQELEDLNKNLEERVVKEVEAKREKEALLIQQSKMATMGQMIGAIAHQWKQPLNLIGLYVQDLTMLYEDGELTEKKIEKFEEKTFEQIDYMSQTIEDFKNFFKPSKAKEEFLVCEAILEVHKLLEAKMKKYQVKFVIHEHEHFPILSYPNEFKQVILNIINNAIDIFSEKEIVDGEINIFIKNDGKIGTITISDNGGGIKASLLPNKVFEAYITTKGDKGTGIGLQISKSIIENSMNGKIEAKNIKNGAEFIIELPIYEIEKKIN